MSRFNNAVVIVTGGAQGIGRSAALKFAKEGATVALVDMNDEKGKQTVAEIGKDGGHAEFFHADVSKSADVKGAVDAIIRSLKRIDVLYNNASIFLPGKGRRRRRHRRGNLGQDHRGQSPEHLPLVEVRDTPHGARGKGRHHQHRHRAAA